MAVKVICVGKIQLLYANAADEYIKRLSRLMPVTLMEVPDEREPVNSSVHLLERIIRKEGQRILARTSPGEHIIAMCADASQPNSQELAEKLRNFFIKGKSDITFLIGGSQGLSSQVLARANEHMSMSRMTFPHQLARVMLLEQLYRAAKINAGERYHK